MKRCWTSSRSLAEDFELTPPFLQRILYCLLHAFGATSFPLCLPCGLPYRRGSIGADLHHGAVIFGMLHRPKNELALTQQSINRHPQGGCTVSRQGRPYVATVLEVAPGVSRSRIGADRLSRRAM